MKTLACMCTLSTLKATLCLSILKTAIPPLLTCHTTFLTGENKDFIECKLVYNSLKPYFNGLSTKTFHSINLRYMVKHQLTAEEFAQVDTLLGEAYQQYHNTDVTRSWWQTYPQGFTVLKEDGKIIGCMTCFPMTAASFYAFLAGEIKENDLQIDVENRTHWYWSDIVIKAAYRNCHNFQTLFSAAHTAWMQQTQRQPFPIQTAALAASISGAKALKGLNLNPFAKTGADGLPIFYNCTKNPLQFLYQQLDFKMRLKLVLPLRFFRKIGLKTGTAIYKKIIIQVHGLVSTPNSLHLIYREYK